MFCVTPLVRAERLDRTATVHAARRRPRDRPHADRPDGCSGWLTRRGAPWRSRSSGQWPYAPEPSACPRRGQGRGGDAHRGVRSVGRVIALTRPRVRVTPISSGSAARARPSRSLPGYPLFRPDRARRGSRRARLPPPVGRCMAPRPRSYAHALRGARLLTVTVEPANPTGVVLSADDPELARARVRASRRRDRGRRVFRRPRRRARAGSPGKAPR